MPAYSPLWTDERLAITRKMWLEDGKSAGEIAKRLNCDLSRSAVIGMISRKGWVRDPATRNYAYVQNAAKARQMIRRPKPKPKAAMEPRTDAGPPKLAALPPPRVRPEDVARVDLVGLERGCCKWPVGEPKAEGFGFCALPAREDAPYCEDHCARAFVPAPMKERKRA